MGRLVILILFLLFSIYRSVAENRQKQQKQKSQKTPRRPPVADPPPQENWPDIPVHIPFNILPEDRNEPEKPAAEEWLHPAFQTTAEPDFPVSPKPALQPAVKEPSAAKRAEAPLNMPLFGRDELVRAMVFSEILAPPLAARRLRRQ